MQLGLIRSPKEVSKGKGTPMKLGLVDNFEVSEFKMPRSPNKKGVSPKAKPKAKTTPSKVPSRSRSKSITPKKKSVVPKSPKKEVDHKAITNMEEQSTLNQESANFYKQQEELLNMSKKNPVRAYEMCNTDHS